MSKTPDTPSPMIVEFLRDADVACPTCQYNLRDTTVDRCPECGTVIRLEVAGSVAGAAWWLAAAMGVATGLLMLLLTVIHQLGDVHRMLDDPQLPRMVSMGMASSSDLPEWSAIVAVAATMACATGVLAWLVMSRRRFSRMGQRNRIICGLLGVSAPILVLGVLRLIVAWL